MRVLVFIVYLFFLCGELEICDGDDDCEEDLCGCGSQVEVFEGEVLFLDVYDEWFCCVVGVVVGEYLWLDEYLQGGDYGYDCCEED